LNHKPCTPSPCRALNSFNVCLQWAFPFAKPVDIHLFKEYPNIIQHPMDFATIKAKVDSGAYQGPQQFYDDVKLVFANARQFNPPGSDVNLMASGVEVRGPVCIACLQMHLASCICYVCSPCCLSGKLHSTC